MNFNNYTDKYFNHTDTNDTPSYKGIAVLDDPYRKKYEEVLKRANINLNDVTPLQMHALFFVDSNTGFITTESVKARFKDLGFNWVKRNALAYFLTKVISESTGETTNTISLQNIHKAIHAADTNIFKSDTGEFSLESFIQLIGFSKDEKFTFADFKRMRQVNYERDKKNGVANLLAGNLAAKGEFDLALDLFADTTKNGKPAISVDTIAKIFLAGPLAFEEVALKKKNKQIESES